MVAGYDCLQLCLLIGWLLQLKLGLGDLNGGMFYALTLEVERIKLLNMVLEDVLAALENKSGLTIENIVTTLFFEVCLGLVLVLLF